MIEIKLRQAPVRPLSSWQGPERRAGRRSKAVRKAGIEGAGIGIAEQSIETVPRALGLGPDLKGVIPGTAYVVDVRDNSEGGDGWGIPATECVPGDRACATRTRLGGTDIQIHAVYQDMRAV